MANWNPFRRTQATTALAETVDTRQVHRVLTEAHNALQVMELLQERITELEMEDEGWIRLNEEGNGFEFDRNNLGNIVRLSRVLALKNPIIKRPVRVQMYYVWGQGVQVQARDPKANEIVQGFLDDPDNRIEFSGHSARMGCEVEVQVAGNLFFVLFEDPRQEGRLKVRSIPFEQVTEIVTDPNDIRRPWFYKREWAQTTYDGAGNATNETRTAYYPDWRYAWRSRPSTRDAADGVTTRPATWAGKPIHWDAPVYHVKAGGYRDMRFGVPETYSAQDWAIAYKNFLEDFATVSRSLARFAWQVSGGKSARDIQGFASRLGTTLGLGVPETNPPPGAGSAFASMNANLQPVRTSGATTGPDEARRLFLMAAAGDGLPETFYGDASVGTLATAKSLDRPTELKFRAQQEMWADVYRDLCNIQLAVAIEYNALQGEVVRDADGDLVRVRMSEDDDTTVDVVFPAILEHDKAAEVTALIDGATLKGQTTKTMPPKLLAQLLFGIIGVPDADEWVEKLYPDGEGEEIPEPDTEPTDPAAMAARDAQRQADQQPQPPNQRQPQVAEAMAVLRRFIESEGK